LLLGLVFFYLWLRALDLGAVISSAATLLFALLPVTYLLALKIWSENTYLCLSLLALWASSRVQSDDATRRKQWWWIAASATAAAIMTRTAALPLALTVAVVIAVRRPKGWSLMISTIWAPFLVWAGWSRLHAGGASLYAQQMTGFYGADALNHFLAQLGSEIPALISAWSQMWVGESAPWSSMLAVAIFGVLSMAGCVMRLLRGQTDAVYATLYIAMLVLWPWPSEATRLLYPLCPILIGHGLWASGRIGSRIGHNMQNAVPYAFSAMLALVVLPSLLICAHRRLQKVPAELTLARQIPSYYVEHGRDAAIATALLLTDMQRLSERIPVDDCVFTIKPSAVLLLGERRAVLPPPADASDRDFAGLLRQCRYAYLMNGQSASFPEPFYPRSRLRQGYRSVSALSEPSGSVSGDLLAELVELPVAQSQ
jgi:hypothetical protein